MGLFVFLQTSCTDLFKLFHRLPLSELIMAGLELRSRGVNLVRVLEGLKLVEGLGIDIGAGLWHLHVLNV